VEKKLIPDVVIPLVSLSDRRSLRCGKAGNHSNGNKEKRKRVKKNNNNNNNSNKYKKGGTDRKNILTIPRKKTYI
jgi:hypothetical protein